MMLRVCAGLVAFACFSSKALPGDFYPSVVINGKRHATGLIRSAPPEDAEYVIPDVADMPKEYDSVAEGFVTAVKDQGQCGSCWTQARTVGLEAATIKAGLAAVGELDLSEQDILLNDRSGSGCGGGYMVADFEVRQGVTTEALCPYKARTRGLVCREPKFVKATRWFMLGTRTRGATDLEVAAAINQYKVVVVHVAAGGLNPDANGKLRTCSARSIDHMVAIVGYRTLADNSIEFKEIGRAHV